MGELVSFCEKNNKTLAQLSIKQFKKHCPAVEQDVYEYLGASNAVKRYVTVGSAGSKQSKIQLNYWQKLLAKR